MQGFTMISIYGLLIGTYIDEATSSTLVSPQMDIKILTAGVLTLSCEVDYNGPRRIYRVQKGDLNLTVTVTPTTKECRVATILPTENVKCECQETYRVECNISHIFGGNKGDQWTCAIYQKGGLMYSNIVNEYMIDSSGQKTMPVHYSTGLTLKEDTMKTETTASIKTEDKIEATTLQDHILDITHAEFNKSVEHVDIHATSLHSGQDTFYKKFIIILSASAVSVVIIAASLLIYLYRKYHHLSNAFVAIVSPVHDTTPTTNNTNAVMPDVEEENRQSTIEIYESIPMMVLSPIADSFPLPQGADILDICADSSSESSIGSVHHYDTVRDSQNVEEPSSSGAGAVSDTNPNETGFYERLTGKRTDGLPQYTTNASSLSPN